jgi:hypothetical protein
MNFSLINLVSELNGKSRKKVFELGGVGEWERGRKGERAKMRLRDRETERQRDKGTKEQRGSREKGFMQKRSSFWDLRFGI